MMSTAIREVPTGKTRGRPMQTALNPPPGAMVALATDTPMDGWHPWESSRLMACPVWFSTTTDPWIVVPDGTVLRARAILSVTPGTGDTSPPQTRVGPYPVQGTLRRAP